MFSCIPATADILDTLTFSMCIAHHLVTPFPNVHCPHHTPHTTPTCVTTRGRVEIENDVNNFPQPLLSSLLHVANYQGHYPALQKAGEQLGRSALIPGDAVSSPGPGQHCAAREERRPRPNFVWKDFIINRDKEL